MKFNLPFGINVTVSRAAQEQKEAAVLDAQQDNRQNELPQGQEETRILLAKAVFSPFTLTQDELGEIATVKFKSLLKLFPQHASCSPATYGQCALFTDALQLLPLALLKTSNDPLDEIFPYEPSYNEQKNRFALSSLQILSNIQDNLGHLGKGQHRVKAEAIMLSYTMNCLLTNCVFQDRSLDKHGNKARHSSNAYKTLVAACSGKIKEAKTDLVANVAAPILKRFAQTVSKGTTPQLP